MTTRVVRTAQGEIEVLDQGTGPAVLFLHGFLVDETFWDGVVARLAGTGLRLIRPTLPLGAHRRAMRPGADLSPPAIAGAVAELVRALDAGPVLVVGNDTGTALAQLLLVREPGLVAGALLTSGDAFEVFPPAIFRPLLLLARAPGGLRLISRLARQPRFARSPMGFGWLTHRGVSRDQARRWAAPLAGDRLVRRDARTACRGLSPRHTLAAAAALGDVAVPVVLGWSEDDRAFPRALADRLAAVLPDSRVVTVPDAAAFSPLDNPEAVADLVLELAGARQS